MTTASDLNNRFQHHPPATPGVADLHGRIRQLCLNLAHGLNEMVPEGREKALSLTNLEQTMFWANAAIARQP